MITAARVKGAIFMKKIVSLLAAMALCLSMVALAVPSKTTDNGTFVVVSNDSGVTVETASQVNNTLATALANLGNTVVETIKSATATVADVIKQFNNLLSSTSESGQQTTLAEVVSEAIGKNTSESDLVYADHKDSVTFTVASASGVTIIQSSMNFKPDAKVAVVLTYVDSTGNLVTKIITAITAGNGILIFQNADLVGINGQEVMVDVWGHASDVA